MKTPITDHASVHTDAFESPDKARNFARRLETDRAELMAALEDLLPIARELVDEKFDACELHYPAGNTAEIIAAAAALSSTRANFPQQ